MDEDGSHSFNISAAAVDELVDALIEEPEVQLVLVPDLVEAEVYRYALHRMICIGQFFLSQLRVCMFGSDVRLEFLVDEEHVAQRARADQDAAESEEASAPAVQEVHV